MNKYLISIFIRYSLLIILGLGNLLIIYSLLAPLTVIISNLLIGLFYDSSLNGRIITLLLDNSRVTIVLVDACIAGSAYYLLLILNLSTPMPIKERFYSLLFLLSSFFVINVLRIFFFTVLFTYNIELFNITHLLFWYVLSFLLVTALWFLAVRFYSIKAIPFYTDIKSLLLFLNK